MLVEQFNWDFLLSFRSSEGETHHHDGEPVVVLDDSAPAGNCDGETDVPMHASPAPVVEPSVVGPSVVVAPAVEPPAVEPPVAATGDLNRALSGISTATTIPASAEEISAFMVSKLWTIAYK